MDINKIYCMDCVEGMKKLEPEMVDLTVTSPPYDALRDYKGFSWDYKKVAEQLFRITKPGGVVVWVVGDATVDGSETGNSFRHALEFQNQGFNIHDTMIYVKVQMPHPSTNRYYQRFEYMFVFSKDKPKTFNPIKDRENKWRNSSWNSINARKKDGSLVQQKAAHLIGSIEKYGVRSNVWIYNVGFDHSTGDKSAKKHPATFPEQLAEDHIKSWSNEGDLVLDPFMGSGTTAKMAKLNNRNFIGFELSKEYCDLATKRVSAQSTLNKWL